MVTVTTLLTASASTKKWMLSQLVSNLCPLRRLRKGKAVHGESRVWKIGLKYTPTFSNKAILAPFHSPSPCSVFRFPDTKRMSILCSASPRRAPLICRNVFSYWPPQSRRSMSSKIYTHGCYVVRIRSFCFLCILVQRRNGSFSD